MPKPLRILFITGEYPPMQGGVADYTRALGQALVATGHQVAVLTSAQAVPPSSDAGIRVFPVVRTWGWSVWGEIEARAQAWQADIIHIQYQTAAYGMHPAINLWPWRPWQRPSLLTAVTFHDLLVPYLFPKAHLVRRWVTQTLARSVDIAITTNPEDTAQLRPVRPDVVEIPIGSNIPDARPAGFQREVWRRHWGVPAQAALLCYFGFLNASKGGEVLVDVLEELVAQGVDAHLLMIGGRVGASDATNDAYLQKVEARIAARGLGQRLHWTGHIPTGQVSAAFHCSDLCLLPYGDGVSYRRGSFMAALNHGMAIVTTPPAVAYPDLTDGETVLFAPPDDIAALTAATVRALQDAELRQRLRANAHQLSQRFSWQAIADRHLEAYRLGK
ncbi:MAG: glycosyltransferase family 4 protein [Chloroflexi bacterium]|nr:glycosyltransferase family 4 protein [Chloroflexota bacterium]